MVRPSNSVFDGLSIRDIADPLEGTRRRMYKKIYGHPATNSANETTYLVLEKVGQTRFLAAFLRDSLDPEK